MMKFGHYLSSLCINWLTCCEDRQFIHINCLEFHLACVEHFLFLCFNLFFFSSCLWLIEPTDSKIHYLSTFIHLNIPASSFFLLYLATLSRFYWSVSFYHTSLLMSYFSNSFSSLLIPSSSISNFLFDQFFQFLISSIYLISRILVVSFFSHTFKLPFLKDMLNILLYFLSDN